MKATVSTIQTVKYPKCKTCKHWKNEQAELDYSSFNGICTCHKWKFDISNYEDIKLLDRSNKTDKHMHVNRFENQNKDVPVGETNASRYCFVTSEGFGCIHHTKK